MTNPADKVTDTPPALLPCPFCGAQPEPPYTNNVGGTYARIKHHESCTFAFGHAREQWLNGMAFERWNTRTSTLTPEEAKELAREIIVHSMNDPKGSYAERLEVNVAAALLRASTPRSADES